MQADDDAQPMQHGRSHHDTRLRSPQPGALDGGVRTSGRQRRVSAKAAAAHEESEEPPAAEALGTRRSTRPRKPSAWLLDAEEPEQVC